MGIYESKYPGLKAKAVNVIMYDISFSFSIFSPSGVFLQIEGLLIYGRPTYCLNDIVLLSKVKVFCLGLR
jgi:hypothetical protein